MSETEKTLLERQEATGSMADATAKYELALEEQKQAFAEWQRAQSVCSQLEGVLKEKQALVKQAKAEFEAAVHKKSNA